MSIAISIFRQSVVVAGFGAKNVPRFRPVRLFQVQECVYFLLSETLSLESYHLFTLMTQGREITVSGGQGILGRLGRPGGEDTFNDGYVGYLSFIGQC